MIKITIYIDLIFFENLIMNSIIIYATSIMLKIKAKFIRILLASAVGSVYAVIMYVSNLEIYSSIILKIILSIIIVYVAFNSKDIKKLLKQTLIFYLTSFVFGGAALYIIYVIKPQEVVINNGMFTGIYAMKSVIIGAVIGLVIIIISVKIIKTKLTKKDMFYTIKITIDGNEIETKAMVDTGNLLKEPITNTPVIVVEYSVLYEVLPKEILNNLEYILMGNFNNISNEIKEKYMHKLKFIPFMSLGKQNGMLIGIKADNAKLINDEQINIIDNVIIGIYSKSLTKRGEYRALVGLELIEN